MESDFVALTDMINAKMLGMFDLIDKWIPQHNTIKKTLLQDINYIGNEIKLFHTNGNRMNHQQRSNGCFSSPKKNTKCRNGKKCWYFKQGRCWFYHAKSNMKDNLKQHDLHHFFQSETKQLSIQPTVDSNRNITTNHSTTTTTTTATNTNKNKKKHKSHAKSHPKSHHTSNNKDCNKLSSKKKKKRRRRKKKKKLHVDSVNILQCFNYNSDESVDSVNSASYDPDTHNDIIVVSSDSQGFDEYDLKDFTIDTIDQKNITIDEGDIMEKIMNYGILEHAQTLHALNQAKLIYQNALVNNQTLEEVQTQVETALQSFIE